MKLIHVRKENLEQEHICCAISNNKDCQVSAKKEWLLQRFDEGLVFLKADFRGKCFIEYIPAENAWAPIEAEGYMYIDCLWIAGQLKGQGYSRMLLDACIEDSKAKGKKGLVILSSKKKKPFLADPRFLNHMGFEICDTAEPEYELRYLPFYKEAEKPRFKDQVRKPKIAQQGVVLYYAHQCPYTAKYVPLLADLAKQRNVPFQAVRFETAEQAQNAPAASTSFSMFFNGTFVTNEILSEAKFEKFIAEKGLQISNAD